MKAWVVALYDNGRPMAGHFLLMKPPLLGKITMEAVGDRLAPTRRAHFTPDDPKDILPDLVDVTIRAILEDEIVLAGISLAYAPDVRHFAQAWRVRPAVLGEPPPANRVAPIRHR